MNTVFLLLGSNLGVREDNLLIAKDLVATEIGFVVQESSIYETEPWGNLDQPNFLNQVLVVKTIFDAEVVLKFALEIENVIGRERKGHWTERVIDIDVLYFNSDILDLPGLKVPHPQIQNRLFTLIPLAEIAPNFEHPVLNLDHVMLLHLCKDTLGVKKFDTNKEVTPSF